ncbi:response regulator [Treponema ruminis]|uniref:Response regulator RpfG family c-di-GMP phosphodiesterase n=1 Tax=Treponema ruminis TaxID=744515 RepID=A0A7W8LN35_9SPIR|nr:HD domain-containing phosphohydrolase [Treponema ruminis]MBB5226968.1 response regulator RpfG family c-di-GMP phosphodiesterase [Treponema ruminis]QSI01395.1 response regulator [Treponema ruminis]
MEKVVFGSQAEVLVVDDSSMILSLMRRILDKTYIVHAVASGEECLEFVQSHIPDLILLDFHMTGIDGLETLHRLKSNPETNLIPVIFLTGDEHNETEIQSLHDGAIDFISKNPLVPGVLLQRVKNTLALTLLQKKLQEEVNRQTLQIKVLTREITEALAKTVDAKDHYTRGHSQRVANYSAEIARRMGKSPKEQEEIYYMGLLHDIGKIGVAGSIIRKNARLTEDEFEEVKEHPMAGYEILKTITVLPNLPLGAKYHHEHFDGSGYPDGLKGYQIPEVARIIAVADVYDAMTSKRAYSEIRPQAVVRAEIERCRGTYFDPDIANVMLRMIDEDIDYSMREVL